MSASDSAFEQAVLNPPAGRTREPIPGTEPAPPAAEPTPQDDRRRRRMALLLILGALVALFAGITGWYLITRKPLTEILPPIAQVSVPQYSFSVYGVQRPMGIAVSPSGDRIYVAETEGQRTIHILDGRGNPIGSFAPPNSDPQSRVPVYVAIEPTSGDVYVSDRTARAVFVFDRDGNYRRTFDPNPALPDWQPLGLAFDGKGDLYVGDIGSPFHRIHEFRLDGTLLRTIGKADQFSFPNGLAVDAAGDLLIADGNHGRVEVLDGTGRLVGGIANGVNDGQLGLPRGLAIDDQGRLYVVDVSGQGVDVYKLGQGQRPSFVTFLGTEGTGNAQFEYPAGVAADARGRIYVADWANDRIQVWSY